MSKYPYSEPVVYVAGPYSNPDPVENTNRAIHVANEVMDLGAVPLIPHLSHMWHLVTPKPYERWLEIDLRLMGVCHAVYRFPGASSGADAEVVEAGRIGLPVFTDWASLRRWVADFQGKAA